MMTAKMSEVIKANKDAGKHFFDEDSMKFFGSRIESDLFPNDMFITSENNFDGSKRFYTIRKFNRETCGIDDVSAFLAYKTKQSAIKAIEQLLQ